ncbi:EAL domain-containing protein [Castellaniella sp.]|uniref:EAL domain-containing protein n=1 Tax=Castellaniella sp. TaxID=1955812 RepID=UPI002AFEF776|nr:EAL domain-containing protein [Castellaniella sp.]
MRLHARTILAIFRLALAFCLALAAVRAQALTLKVGIYDQKPDVYIGANGRPAGILGELLNEIARREGWTLQTQSCAWETCLQLLADRQIDLLPDVYYTPERAQIYGLHHVPALHSWSQIYAAPNSGLHSITDLKGHTVAVLAGSTQQDYLRTTLDGLGIQAQIVPVQQLEEGFQMVSRHQADAVAADFYIGELTARDYNLAVTAIVFQPTQAFFATPKGEYPEVLAAIDRYLGIWQADPNSFYFRTLDHWRTPQSRSVLSDNAVWIVAGMAGLLALVLCIVLGLKIQMNRQRERLRSSERRLDAILDSVDAIVSIKDPNGLYVFANRKLEEFLGVGPGDAIGHRDADFITDPQSLNSIEQSDQTILNTRERSVIQQTLKRPDDGDARTLLTMKAPLHTPDGGIEAICVVATDITDRLLAERTAHRLTYYDSLTNLPNRRMALERLEQVIEHAQIDRGCGALLQIDLDNFKRINDTQGYRVGDQVLAAIAERLAHATRERDLVAHTSADEFVVLIDGLSPEQHDAARIAMHIADKLRLAISGNALTIQESPVFVTASIGLTLIHAGSQTSDRVMREADMATQRAKEQGGNQATFYEQELQAEVEQRLWLERDLLQAINTPQLSLHLQPQFGQDGRVSGGELLARWHHPTRGAISPALFIPVAEESGLINLLGAWTLGVACDTLLTLQSLGETYPLSINVSPKRLMDPQFVDYVRNMLEQKGLPGNRLIFEVTEGVLIQDIQAVARRMQALARLGIRFSIDDFGTGYSNLAYLKRLPLYELKIDKSLIQDLPHDTDGIAIVQMILAMADQLNLRVVAEGVETEDQSRFLFQHDCHALQGFLLARPMPIDAWISIVRERGRVQ